MTSSKTDDYSVRDSNQDERWPTCTREALMDKMHAMVQPNVDRAKLWHHVFYEDAKNVAIRTEIESTTQLIDFIMKHPAAQKMLFWLCREPQVEKQVHVNVAAKNKKAFSK